MINDTFASFFCRISSIPFNVITEFYEADAREALETMPGAWYMALWVLDTAIVTTTIISRRDKSKTKHSEFTWWRNVSSCAAYGLGMV